MTTTAIIALSDCRTRTPDNVSSLIESYKTLRMDVSRMREIRFETLVTRCGNRKEGKSVHDLLIPV